MTVRGVGLQPARPALLCPPPTRPRTHRRCATHVRQQLHDVAASALPSSASQVPVHTLQAEVEVSPGKLEGYWSWKGYKIRYQRSGSTGLPILLVHGFGGNADHFRKNTVVLGAQHRTYAIDLLGYGFSSKPDPRNSPPNSIYNFTTWGQQLCDFLEQVVGEPAVLVCNSVGGLAGLEASILRPDLVKAVQLLDISLRGLHVKRQPPWQRPLVAAFQQLLRETELGVQFFNTVAKPQTVKNILGQAYGNKAAVTDELVQCILRPGLQPGAVRVFLDFISYSGGPLPEELLAATKVPVSIVWGEADPWEDVRLGRTLFANQPTVYEFVTLPGVGHCPMDESPELVNPLIEAFAAKHV
ncbi:Alpha/Beta hydrolase protein [Haematococcus lacustris]